MWEAVRRYDGTSAALIARYERACLPYRGADLPSSDLVHGDLNLSNLILNGGHVAAVIDMEAVSGGSRAYDLVSLAASAARDGAPDGVDETFFEAALRAGGRASVAIGAASAYANVAAFAWAVAPESLPLIQLVRGC